MPLIQLRLFPKGSVLFPKGSVSVLRLITTVFPIRVLCIYKRKQAFNPKRFFCIRDTLYATYMVVVTELVWTSAPHAHRR